MKLEEAIKRVGFHLYYSVFRNFPGFVDALETILQHIEATRWRKLSEEPPTTSGRCLLRCESLSGHVYYREDLIRSFTPGKYFLTQLAGHNVTHWQPIVGQRRKDDL